MTSLWLDDDAEADDLCGDDDIECEDDLQLEFDAAQALCERAFAQARQRVLRRRAARPSASKVQSTQRATAATLRNLDIETKVHQDSFRKAFAAQGRRMILSEYSAVAGAAVNQFIESFDAPQNPYARAALRFSPLLLMSPQRRGLADPRLIGAAAVAGVVILGESRTKSRKPRDIKILAPRTLSVGDSVKLVADVVDSGNVVVPGAAVVWSSSNPAVAKVDPATGAVSTTSPCEIQITTTGPGVTVISAALGNLVGRVVLTVTSGGP